MFPYPAAGHDGATATSNAFATATTSDNNYKILNAAKGDPE